MSVVMPWVYLNAARRTDIQAAIGGEVWWDDWHLHWRPSESEMHVSVPWRELHEPFDADELVNVLLASWACAGAVV